MTSKSAAALPVHPRDDAVLDHELGLGVVRAVHRDEAELGRRRDQHLAPQLLLGPRREPAAAGALRHRRALARAYATAASRTKAAVRGASQSSSRTAHSSSSAGVERPGPERRVDREQLVVGHAGELGGALEVVRELAPARRAGDRGLAPQRGRAWRERRPRRACRHARIRASPPRARGRRASRRDPVAASQVGSRRLDRKPSAKLYMVRLVTNDDRFFGRVALVTGAASGIGAAVAARLLAEGAKVATFDLGAAEPGRRARASRATSPASADVDAAVAQVDGRARPDRRARLLRRRVRELAAHARTSSDAEWKKVMAINADGVFWCNRAVAPGMAERGYGRIVNVASIAGKEGNPMAAAYSASKAAVIALTKAVGKDFARTGVSVNCIAPAVIETAMLGGHVAGARRLHGREDPDGPDGQGRGGRGADLLARERGVLVLDRRDVRHLGRPGHVLMRATSVSATPTARRAPRRRVGARERGDGELARPARRCCGRSTRRRCGAPASPTSAAATRASRSRAATSTRSSTTPTGPSSSSRTRPAAAPSGRTSRSRSAPTRRGTSPSPRSGSSSASELEIVGYTIGNDVSSRDIEGANPLYLPQAKVFAAACAIGPAVYVPEDWDAPLEIFLTIRDADGSGALRRRRRRRPG